MFRRSHFNIVSINQWDIVVLKNDIGFPQNKDKPVGLFCFVVLTNNKPLENIQQYHSLL